MYIQRDRYLDQLKARKNNKLVKVITGLRRSGKSFLLFNIYYDYLLSIGVKSEHIIKIALDDDRYASLCDVQKLSTYIRSKITSSKVQYYLFIDEAQFAISKEELKQNDDPIQLYLLLNGLLHLGNVDIYITGSNSKFLSKDILSSFRGRGDVIHLFPLSFLEVYTHIGEEVSEAYEEYIRYGGMPFIRGVPNEVQKEKYLLSLVSEIYLKDIVERYSIKYEHILDQLIALLFSVIGSLTNANKLNKTLLSAGNKRLTYETVASYLIYLTDSFLFSEAKRFDVRGKRYFTYPSKYYATDIGIRNAYLSYRQQEETHLMENVIYNELLLRDYRVDVGVVELFHEGKQKQVEIDFVANKGFRQVYIQSALTIEDPTKRAQEKRPLLAIDDSFLKVIITKTGAKKWVDEDGILYLGIYEFLLDENSLSF